MLSAFDVEQLDRAVREVCATLRIPTVNRITTGNPYHGDTFDGIIPPDRLVRKIADRLVAAARQRAALSRVLLQVEVQEHNRAVLAADVDMTDYTRAMEAGCSAAEREAAQVAIDRAHAASFEPTAADLDLATERAFARRDEQDVTDVEGVGPC